MTLGMVSLRPPRRHPVGVAVKNGFAYLSPFDIPLRGMKAMVKYHKFKATISVFMCFLCDLAALREPYSRRVTQSHHHSGGELPFGSGTVFDVKVRQIVGAKMGDVE